jgi:hypothetical protein
VLRPLENTTMTKTELSEKQQFVRAAAIAFAAALMTHEGLPPGEWAACWRRAEWLWAAKPKDD